jgi:hypothetical protein
MHPNLRADLRLGMSARPVRRLRPLLSLPALPDSSPLRASVGRRSGLSPFARVRSARLVAIPPLTRVVDDVRPR